MNQTILNDNGTSEFPCMDHLFHYTSVPIALEQILGRGMLRFSPISSMHDPLEFAPPCLIYTEGNQCRLSGINDVLSKTKVACFCQSKMTSDRFGWGVSRSRMWSQYADSHRGVCLVFSKEALIKAVAAQYDVNETFFHQEIMYDNRVNSRLVREESNDIVKHIQQHARQYFFQKREDYRDENEYRMVICDTSKMPGDPVEIPCLSALKALILGCRTNHCYADNFLDFGYQQVVEILKISWTGTTVVFRKPQPFRPRDRN